MSKKLKLLLLFFGLIIFLAVTINFYSAGIQHDCALYVLFRVNGLHIFACASILTITCFTLIEFFISLRRLSANVHLIRLCNLVIKFAPAVFVTLFLATALNVVVFNVLVSLISVYALTTQIIEYKQKRNDEKGSDK